MPKVDLDVTAKDKASGVLKGLTGQLIKTALTIDAVKMAARKLAQIATESVDAFILQERQEAKLNAVIKSTGGVAGYTSKELIEMAQSFQKTTTYGDEAVIGAQNLLLTFTKIGHDIFPKATETILNMSAALGQDLQSSAIQVGKALNDPVQGISALRRVGVQLSAEQENQIKQFMAVNDIASAQGIILGELETQFGGVAEAIANTKGGQLEQLSNNVGDLSESFGSLIISMLPAVEVMQSVVFWLTEVVDRMNKVDDTSISMWSGYLEQMVEDGKSLDDALGSISMLTGKSKEEAAELYLINDELKTLYQEQKDILENQLTLHDAIFGQISSYFAEQKQLQDEANQKANEWAENWATVIDDIETKFKEASEKGSFADMMGDDYDLMAEKAKILEGAIADLIKNGYSVEGDTIQGLIRKYQDIINESKDFSDATANITDSVGGMAGKVKERVAEVVNSIGGMAGAMGKVEIDWSEHFDEILNMAQGFVGQFSGIIGNIGSIVSQNYDNMIAELDRSLQIQLNMIDEWVQNQLELYGVAEETKIEKLQREVEETQAALDAETDASEQQRLAELLAELQAELLRQQIYDEGNQMREDAEREAALKRHKLEVQQFYAEQKFARAQAWLEYGQGIMAMIARAAGMLFGRSIFIAITSALLTASLGTSLGYIDKQEPPPAPTFENSGIVPGSSYYGDKVNIRANSGEMYLNKSDQTNLLNMIKGGSGGGMTIGSINLPNVTNASQFVRELKEIQRREKVLN